VMMSSSRTKKEKRHIKKVWTIERKLPFSCQTGARSRDYPSGIYHIKFMIIITLI